MQKHFAKVCAQNIIVEQQPPFWSWPANGLFVFTHTKNCYKQKREPQAALLVRNYTFFVIIILKTITIKCNVLIVQLDKLLPNGKQSSNPAGRLSQQQELQSRCCVPGVMGLWDQQGCQLHTSALIGAWLLAPQAHLEAINSGWSQSFWSFLQQKFEIGRVVLGCRFVAQRSMGWNEGVWKSCCRFHLPP